MRIEDRSADHDKDIKRTRELDSSDIVIYNDIANVNCNKTLTNSCLGIHGSGFHYTFLIRELYGKISRRIASKKRPFFHVVHFGIVVFFKRVSEIRRFSN